MRQSNQEGWGATRSPAAQVMYWHFFKAGQEKSQCGRSDRQRLTAEPSLQRDERLGFASCKVCQKLVERERRVFNRPVVQAGALPEDRLSCADAVAVMGELLGVDYMSANALYNRVWRVMNTAADPATAPEFVSLSRRVYFTRKAIVAWIAGQVSLSHGMSREALHPELQAALGEAD